MKTSKEKNLVCWKSILLSFFILHSSFLIVSGQTPTQIIHTVNQRFSTVSDYKADVHVLCNIPAIKIDAINAKVFYKRPDKFKVKAAGILILPKQNVNFLFTTLADTGNYTAVKTGEEILSGVTTQVINVIPNKDTSDLILGKFWIDVQRGLVLKSQLTTKSQGTILIENTFGSMAAYALPDQMVFTVDTKKFKLPKALAMDINSSSREKELETDDGKGRVTLTFSNYIINKGVTAEELK